MTKPQLEKKIAELNEQNNNLLTTINELQEEKQNGILVNNFEFDELNRKSIRVDELERLNQELTTTNNELVKAIAVREGSITAKLTDVIHKLVENKVQ